MSHTVELSEQSYKVLAEIAQHSGQTPEAVLETLIDAASQKRRVYDDLDDFFRSLGATEEELRTAEQIFQGRERDYQAQLEAADDADV